MRFAPAPPLNAVARAELCGACCCAVKGSGRQTGAQHESAGVVKLVPSMKVVVKLVPSMKVQGLVLQGLSGKLSGWLVPPLAVHANYTNRLL